MLKRLLRIALLVLAGSLVLGVIVASCTTLYLPFGFTVNMTPASGDPLDATLVGERLRLPRGFALQKFAEGIPNARSLAFTAGGHLLVSAPREGKIWVVDPDRDGDGRSDGQRVLVEGFDRPFGLALFEDWIYIGETGAIRRARFDGTRAALAGPWETVVGDLPAGGNHWTRTIAFGPDGWLYVSVGSTCNVCIEEDPRRAAMLRFRPDGTQGEIYATGLRNSVGFAWQPGTGNLYATDNGRDLLGDDFPPCELNRIVEDGFYGWPYANGANIPDPDFGDDAAKVAASRPPVFEFAAHNAPLGIEFYGGTRFPERYRGAAFVALHGSWNRARKDGYRVVALWIDGDQARAEDFLVGFEVDDDVIGRPVDLATGADGSLYLSDDYSGTIFRIAYGEAGSSAVAAPVAPRVDPLLELSAERLAQANTAGEALWQRHACAQCHLPGGAVEAYRPLAALKARYDVDALVAFLRTPQPPMPIFELDDDERRDLAIHLLQRFP